MSWIIFIAIVVLQVMVAIILQYAVAKARPREESTNELVENFSIIIPFHNEANRIQPLIDSLNRLKIGKNIEFVFVDDYSTDATAKILEAGLNHPFRCVKNEGKRGKKTAIRIGVGQTKHDYIVTWDADVMIPADYFKKLRKIPIADLNIFPVYMESSKLIGKLAIVEFSFLETLGFAMANMKSPMICYGANLGFSKACFLEVDGERSDYDIPSGDDLFLLGAMQNKKKEINAYASINLAVKTQAPTSFKALIQQRRRWFGKMGSLINWASLAPLLLLIVVQMVAVFSWFFVFDNPWFLIPLGIKYIAELIASWQFVRRSRLHWLVVLIHQVWYPIYIIGLAIPFEAAQNWKNDTN